MNVFLIWSEEHGLWWRSASMGYTASMKEAGRYSYAEARKISDNANAGGTFAEVPVPLTPDMLAVFDLPSAGRSGR
jgi:hypothetical protein